MLALSSWWMGSRRSGFPSCRRHPRSLCWLGLFSFGFDIPVSIVHPCLLVSLVELALLTSKQLEYHQLLGYPEHVLRACPHRQILFWWVLRHQSQKHRHLTQHLSVVLEYSPPQSFLQTTNHLHLPSQLQLPMAHHQSTPSTFPSASCSSSSSSPSPNTQSSVYDTQALFWSQTKLHIFS